MAEHVENEQSSLKLKRFLAPRSTSRAEESCEFCNAEIGDKHSHVVNIVTRNVICACRSCYLLFMREGSAQGKYKAVPQRYLYLPGLVLTDAQWEKFQIPVGIAFFFHNTPLGRVTAFYPSPAGATESLLPLETWDEITQANPVLESLVSDVEALLVYNIKRQQKFECYIVPIDACYELVGHIKQQWRGFDGGDEAWKAIEAFFTHIRMQSEEGGISTGSTT